MSWIMCAWSLCTMLLMSERRYLAAWISSFASQFGWAWVAWQAGLPGMVAFSAVMLCVAGRALWRLWRDARAAAAAVVEQ